MRFQFKAKLFNFKRRFQIISLIVKLKLCLSKYKYSILVCLQHFIWCYMSVLYNFLSVNAKLFISLNKECSIMLKKYAPKVFHIKAFLKTQTIDIHNGNNLLDILQGLGSLNMTIHLVLPFCIGSPIQSASQKQANYSFLANNLAKMLYFIFIFVRDFI